MKKLLTIMTVALAFIACGNQIPDTYVESKESPAIYPDYLSLIHI